MNTSVVNSTPAQLVGENEPIVLLGPMDTRVGITITPFGRVEITVLRRGQFTTALYVGLPNDR